MLKWASPGQDEAFEVALSVACRQGGAELRHRQSEGHAPSCPDRGQRQQDRAGEQKSGGGGGGARKKEEDFENRIGTTANMVRSALCDALFRVTCMAPSTLDSWNVGQE